MARKTWKDKLTKTQMKHIKETTQRSTLSEVKQNIAFQAQNTFPCWECIDIARKLGIEIELSAFHNFHNKSC